MSHVATNWAFQQRGLKPSAKIVLLILADCHNPANGCFPTQAFLADACEMNRDTVNVQLAHLEERGLIRRVRSIDPATKRQRPTRYKLAFEADFSGDDSGGEVDGRGEKTVSEIPTQTPKSVSEIPAEPCRIYGQSRVGNSDTNLVKRTSKGTSKAASAAFDRFWAAYPRKVEKLGARKKFDGAVKSGVDPDRIVAGAEAYARSDAVRRGFVKHPTTWLNRGCWDDDLAPARQPELAPASQEMDQRRAFLRRVAGGAA